MKAEFLIPIAFFAMIFGIVYISIRRKERMAMIQRGADASLFESKKTSFGNLKWGLLFVGIGAGILLGRLFAAYTNLGEEASYFSMICLLGGLSLVIYHFMAKKRENKEQP